MNESIERLELFDTLLRSLPLPLSLIRPFHFGEQNAPDDQIPEQDNDDDCVKCTRMSQVNRSSYGEARRTRVEE